MEPVPPLSEPLAQGEQLPRFGAHAARYHRFRPGYPPVLFDRLAAEAGKPHAHAVDLGAGTGQATGDLLRRFERVTAVEPDAAMAHLIPADLRLNVLNAKAEDVTLPAHDCDLVLAATAFHWMDKPLVLARARDWLRPGGVFAAFMHNVATWRPKPVQDVVLAHYHLWRSVMHERLSSFEPYEDVVRASNLFSRVEAVHYVQEIEMVPSAAAGFLMTTSYGTAYARQAAGEEAYLASLTAEIAAALGPARLIGRFPIEGAFGVA
jgi:trans-aconitate methyltransferase